MVLPVVVKAAMVSKKASVTVFSEPVTKKGTIPNKEKNTHTDEVSNKPSRLFIDELEGLMR